MPLLDHYAENPTHHQRPRPVRSPALTEEVVLERLEQLQEAVSLPPEIWNLLVEVLCPDSHESPPLPALPTTALPGTLERIQVMADRADRGEQLYHPNDAQWDNADRLSIDAIMGRNGILHRMSMAHVEYQGAEGRQPAAALQEGFFLPGECLVVVGRLPPAKRPSRRRKATTNRCQRLLFSA